jgi:hypothetical protein
MESVKLIRENIRIMKNINKTLFGLCALGLFANTTLAATLSITPTTSDQIINDTFTLTIGGEGFNQSVDGVGVTVSWDPAILAYAGTEFINPQWDTTSTNSSNAESGIIDTIFAGSSSGAGTDFQLAEISFTALSLGSTDVLIGASGGGCVPGACGAFSEGGELLTDYGPAHVNVVPIPAAVWLFGSALLGLIGFSRKQ